jgi:hypothetical protein
MGGAIEGNWDFGKVSIDKMPTNTITKDITMARAGLRMKV